MGRLMTTAEQIKKLDELRQRIPDSFIISQPGDVCAVAVRGLPHREVVHPVEDDGYDVWVNGSPKRFGLSLDEAARALKVEVV